jgi:hypothetical protein
MKNTNFTNKFNVPSVFFQFKKIKNIFNFMTHIFVCRLVFCGTLIFKFILVLILLSSLIMIIKYFNLDLYLVNITSNYIPDGSANDKNFMDPVRYWPSGLPQSVGIVGTALATFSLLNKMSNVSPRFRVLGALGAAGVSATTITYHSAIENPVGFNRFMYGLTEYRRTGHWPSLESIKNNVSDSVLEDFVKKQLINANNEVSSKVVQETVSKINSNNSNSFLPDEFKYLDNFQEIIDNFTDRMFNFIGSLIRPVPVEGYFDDLVGQQIMIHIILFILLISIIILILFYFINIIFLFNKEKIINRFNNKIITFYIKYQSFLAKLALIYLPIFILLGLLVLFHGLYFLITHQIPYEQLGVDLHTYITFKYDFTSSHYILPNEFNIIKFIQSLIISNLIYIINLNIKIILVNEYYTIVISAIFSFLVFTFLIDGLKFSENKFINILQKILFYILGFILIFFIYQYFFGTIIEWASDVDDKLTTNFKKDSEINVGVSGNISVSKEGGEAIAKSLNNTAAQIGIGTSIGGVASAVASVVKSTSLPPLQKVGLTLAGGAIGGAIHAGTTATNRAIASGIFNIQSTENSGRNSPEGEFSPASPLENLIFNSNDNSVETLLFSIYSLNIISLILFLMLILNLISKLVLNNNLELKWLDKLMPQPYNNKCKKLIINILKYSNKSNTINIAIILILLLISNFGSIYLLTILINNFEIFCKVYLKSII